MNGRRVALAIFSGKLFLYLQFWKICGFSRIASSREQKNAAAQRHGCAAAL
ncbi:hypothetical protein [Faecalibacterium sp. PGM34]